MLEFYTAYFDCADVMDTTEALCAAAAARVAADRSIVFKGREVSFRLPFPRLSMKDAIARTLGMPRGLLDDPQGLGTWVRTREFRGRCEAARLDAQAYEEVSHGRGIALLFEDFVEETLWDPTFVTDHPVEISPLSEAMPADPTTANRFALLAAGKGLANRFPAPNEPPEARAGC